jgi:DNA-binding SARP family transcriptional activator
MNAHLARLDGLSYTDIQERNYAMARYRCLLLGPPQIKRHNQIAQITLQKAIALVAYLAVEQRAFSREYLATMFWPDLGTKRALANLRRILAHLRSTIEAGCIITERDQVELNRLFIDVDVNEFHSLLSSQSSDSDPARLEEAAGLYRGSFLEGFNLGNCPEFDEWQDAVRESLRLELYELLETLIRGYLAKECPELTFPFARRWLKLDRSNEAAHRALMEIYARTGRTHLARKQFESCTELLAQEGIEPDDRTCELNDAIVNGRFTPLADPVGISLARRMNPPTKTKRARSRRFRIRIALVIAAGLAVGALVNGIWYRSFFSTEKDLRVDIKYSGQDRLDEDNPIKVFIDPYDQTSDSYS